MNDGNLISYLLGLAVFGLIVGAIARLLIPGRNPMGCLGTILAGVAGSFLAGLVGRVLFGRGYTAGWIASILGAVVVVYLFTRAGRRRAHY
ncbi:MAG: GlsB/YeaQ/YmgE family stress response membrane protein [Actinomycetota bacterium]|nr:GlsB/YeaQ/YmgE family stress response membrane protein [Actinomycetota bacterium]